MEKPVIIGSSKLLKNAIQFSDRIFDLDLPILIEGEVGTGKELFASYIHSKSNKYINTDFYSINANSFEEELTNILKIVKTQKLLKQTPIKIGTIYIKEIEQLSKTNQSILLRYLETKELILSKKIYLLDFKLILSTKNIDKFLQKVQEEHFKEDLYLQLTSIKLTIPSLRDRKEDIPLLINHYVTYFSETYKKRINELGKDLINALMSFDWIGNVAQLVQLLETMISLSKGNKLDLSNIPNSFFKTNISVFSNKINIQPGFTYEEYERQIIKVNLEMVGGKKKQCANILKISERNLYRKLKYYNL